MTSRCLYEITLRLLFVVSAVSFRACLSAITSKACYGPQGLPCTKHTLECSSGMIAIQDAYYTNSGACPNVGLSNCGNINVSSIPDTGRYCDLNETQLNTLYRDCSTKSRCTFNGERWNLFFTFSVVKYTCISDDHNLCGSVNTQTSDASLLWKRNNSPDGNNTCTCTISTLQSNTYLSLTALDMRLNDPLQLCPGVTISVDGNNLPINCSQLSPYQLLVNTSQQVQVTVNKGEAHVNGVVWLRIQGSNTMQLICNKKFIATTDFGGIYVAGVSTGVVVSLLCGFLIYLLFIRRRFVLTKKQDSVPPSAAHPTYDGLTELQQSNNYDVINHQDHSENMQSSLYENVANRP